MTWKWCSNFGDDQFSVFVAVGQSYKLDGVVKYEDSKLHVESESLHNSRNQPISECETSNIKPRVNEL